MSKPDKKIVKTNEELARLLSKLVEENKYLRFGQILDIYGFVKRNIVPDHITWLDEFYADPTTVLERVKEQIKKMKGDTNEKSNSR